MCRIESDALYIPDTDEFPKTYSDRMCLYSPRRAVTFHPYLFTISFGTWFLRHYLALLIVCNILFYNILYYNTLYHNTLYHNTLYHNTLH